MVIVADSSARMEKYSPGDILFSIALPWQRFRVNDTAIVRHPQRGYVARKILAIDQNEKVLLQDSEDNLKFFSYWLDKSALYGTVCFSSSFFRRWRSAQPT